MVTVQRATKATIIETELAKLQVSIDGNRGESGHISAPARHTKQREGTAIRESSTAEEDLQEAHQALIAIQTEHLSGTHKLEISPNMAALYLSRTIHVAHIGYCNRKRDDGRLDSVCLQDTRRIRHLWEQHEHNYIKFGKLASLLSHLYKLSHERRNTLGKEAPHIAVSRQNEDGNAELRIISPPENFLKPPLPQYIIGEMWTEAVLRFRNKP